ncbi:MAG: hypothetical protein IT380_16635 [Myxococcales bacterium]|nr:hypothetical protein [Myxococcales bacterium]
MRRLLLGVTLVLAGCGGGLSATSPLMMTCDLRTNSGAAAHGQCQEWRGDKQAETNVNVDFNVLCTSTLSGTVFTGECPTGAVGVCTKRPSVAQRVVLHFYYAPDWDASTASADCTGMGGGWAAR